MRVDVPWLSRAGRFPKGIRCVGHLVLGLGIFQGGRIELLKSGLLVRVMGSG